MNPMEITNTKNTIKPPPKVSLPERTPEAKVIAANMQIYPRPIKPHTAKDEVLRQIRAMGPCTIKKLHQDIKEQVMGIDYSSAAWEAAIQAINELAREGMIELYDTGDAWDVTDKGAKE